MNRQDLKCIKKEVAEIRQQNVEEKYLMFVNFLECYIVSFTSLGLNHKITRDVLNAFKEFCIIMKKEDYILSRLIKKYNKLEIDQANNLLNDLDLLNEKTYKYYESVFCSIEENIEVGGGSQVKKYRKDFKTLLEFDLFADK